MKANEPAFPTDSEYEEGGAIKMGQKYNCGISTRDYIAIKAMQGILSCPLEKKGEIEELAYKIADAMIAESNKPKLSKEG